MIVVADDTDILVLLWYIWNSEMGDIILQSMSKKKENIVNVRNAVSHLNKTVVKNMHEEDVIPLHLCLIKEKLLFLT